MASSPVKKKYISPVYEDRYFPEKNAAVPFKWETSPGTPKFDVDAYQSDDDKQESCMHNMCNENYTDGKQGNRQCMQESRIHTPHAHAHAMTSIYPLRLPPKVSSPGPLHVKDLLLQHGTDHFDDEDDDQQQQLSPHDICHVHAHPRAFSRFSFRFRSFKASTIVPVYKNRCAITRLRNLGVDGSQASPLFVHAPFQGRSQSFSHAAKHGAVTEAKQTVDGSNVAGHVLARSPRRRCNSFNFQSAHHSIIDHDNISDADEDLDNDPSSMAAVAVWAGACILAAATAHDHDQNDPCRVATKLRDLMQQSANFSDLELPKMLKLKKGGGSAMNENLAQLALCHAKMAPAVAKRKTKSLEEEVREAFLREGMKESCTHDDDEDIEPTKVEKSTLEGDDDQQSKLVKRKSFLKVFKNECIACWCPSPTL